MKGKLVNKYNAVSKTTGRPYRMYVYELSGTKQELQDYEETQGENLRYSETKKPLFFSPGIFEGNNPEIVKGSSVDPVTSNLVPRYRALSDEKFELERSILSQSIGNQVVKPQAETIITNPTDF